MVGSCDADSAGLIPTAIGWLFRGIAEQKTKTGARFSVRVSAVEVAGPTEVLRDLLAPHATGTSPSFVLSNSTVYVIEINSIRQCRIGRVPWRVFAGRSPAGHTTAKSKRTASPDSRKSGFLFGRRLVCSYRFIIARRPILAPTLHVARLPVQRGSYAGPKWSDEQQ